MEVERQRAAARTASAGGCGCKGVRSCLLCETAPPSSQERENFVYCPLTGLAVGEEHSKFAGWFFPFPGVFLLEDFIRQDEEYETVELMDRSVWMPSQSGRKKQDYGPKVNFKKRKLKVGDFDGLPSFSQRIVMQMKDHSVLTGFSPVEQCNLDYSPERGSAIDPHLDDWWLWGERLVSVNLLSETVLSMSCDLEETLQLFPACQNETVHGPESSAVSQGCHPTNLAPTEGLRNASTWSVDCSSHSRWVPSKEVIVAIHLPRRSLIVLYGQARYSWKHAIYRSHIKSRRICITFRELSAEFRQGGKQEELGKKLLERALRFRGTLVSASIQGK